MASSSPPTKAKVTPSKPIEAVETSPDLQTDFWGTIMTDKGQHDVRMKDDTGTSVNWIHPDLAKRLKLEVESLGSSDTRAFLDFSGKPVTAKQAVRFTWSGRNNKTYFEQFYVAPAKSDIDVVLGKTFVDKNGRDKEVCNHKRRKDTVRWLGSSKETVRRNFLSIPLVPDELDPQFCITLHG